MYPEQLVAPMMTELTQIGFEELDTPEKVDATLPNSKGTVLLMVNSVCGCAAGTARPGVKLAVTRSTKKPDKLASVFAGFNTEATAQARTYLLPYPPSSPAIALFKDGELVHMVERHHIEGRPAEIIAQHLEKVFEHFC